VRIALGQVDTTVGDLPGNVDLLTAWASRATEADADVVVFPELAITGYPPEDLVLRPSFVDDNLTALDALAANTAGGASIVVGFVDRTERGIHNSAAVIGDGQVIARYHKIKLPNYGVFDEARTFTPGDAACPIRLADSELGLSVCEDAWTPGPPFDEYARRKTPVILNINGSPFHRGKADERIEICRERALETGSWIVYVNAVGGQDELVFDGGAWSFGRTDRSPTTPRCSRRTSSSSISTVRPRARRNARRGPTISSRCTSASSSGCGTTSARTASRRSCSACRAGSTRRSWPSSRRTRSARGPSVRSRCPPPSPRPRASRTRGRSPPGSGSVSTCSRSGTCSRPTWRPFAERSGAERPGSPRRTCRRGSAATC
jgi:predicted amidohydrolase